MNSSAHNSGQAGDPGPAAYAAAQSVLFHRLRLRIEYDEPWTVLNLDRERAAEFADYYFTHPELRGDERDLCVGLVVFSAVDLIEPDPGDRLQPAPDHEAERLIRRLLIDPDSKNLLEGFLLPTTHASGFFPRIARLYEQLTGVAIGPPLPIDEARPPWIDPDGTFNPYAGIPGGEYHRAQTRLFHRLRLRNRYEEDWAARNSDRDRALEFADFYLSHPELRGHERTLCAEMVSASAVEFIEPEPFDEVPPAPDDVAQALVARLYTDPYTRHFLERSVRPDMRASGFYLRLAEIYDRVRGT